MNVRRLLRCTLAFAVTAPAACSAPSPSYLAASAREGSLKAAVLDFRFELKPALLEKRLRELLHDRGFELPQGPLTHDQTIETTRRAGVGRSQEWFQIRIIQADDDEFFVHLDQCSELPADGNQPAQRVDFGADTRDWALEWELIQRVAPEAAADMRRDAGQAADAEFAYQQKQRVHHLHVD